MERDFFKQYVDEHRDGFENEALPPHLLNNILRNLKEREQLKAKRRIKLNYIRLAIACSLFLVAGTYLFMSEGAKTTEDPNVASNIIGSANRSIISKNEIKSPIKKLTVKKQGKAILSQLKPEPFKDIYNSLMDSSSVANRMNAILSAGTLAHLNTKLKVELCRTFSKDDNDNVRLAALGILVKFSTDKYIHEQLVESLSKQKDPVVQLELIKILGSNSSPETTNKLIAMANNPFTVDAVKEQVYYALLTNNN
jgi:hypothetical protein